MTRDMPQFSEWTTRLGQQHWALVGRQHYETLCGMAMLGNNYATVYLEDRKKPCAECVAERARLEKLACSSKS